MKVIGRMVPALLAVMLAGVSACSEKAEQEAATETADQMEEAAMLGRTAAKQIVGKEWKDTMELHKAILHARALSSKYDLNKDRKSREAFDSAFFHTIKVVRPDLAKEIAE